MNHLLVSFLFCFSCSISFCQHSINKVQFSEGSKVSFEAGNTGITLFDLDSPASSKSWEANQSMLTDVSIDQSKFIAYLSSKGGMINSCILQEEGLCSFSQKKCKVNALGYVYSSNLSVNLAKEKHKGKASVSIHIWAFKYRETFEVEYMDSKAQPGSYFLANGQGEFQQYVSEQAFELSGGRQQPTSRIENQTINFRVW